MKPLITWYFRLVLEISHFDDSLLPLAIVFIWKALLQIFTCGQKSLRSGG